MAKFIMISYRIQRGYESHGMFASLKLECCKKPFLKIFNGKKLSVHGGHFVYRPFALLHTPNRFYGAPLLLVQFLRGWTNANNNNDDGHRFGTDPRTVGQCNCPNILEFSLVCCGAAWPILSI